MLGADNCVCFPGRALLAAQDAAIAALKVGNVLGDARAAAVEKLTVRSLSRWPCCWVQLANCWQC